MIYDCELTQTSPDATTFGGFACACSATMTRPNLRPYMIWQAFIARQGAPLGTVADPGTMTQQIGNGMATTPG
eukprot:3784462-Pyramimonas_sp.AAC.1